MRKIVYIGNNLQSKNPTTQALLFKALTDLGFEVELYSNKENIFSRLIDMCFGIIKNRDSTNFVLIDTYSTLNFYFTLVTSQLARLFSIKYIPILHGGNLNRRLQNNRFYSNLIFSNAHMNISPSKYLLEVFKNNGYKTLFIPNVIEIAEYNFINRKNLNFNLLWVRAFDKIYNPKMAISVLIELVKRGYKAKLCMVGPDKDGSLNEVIKLAEENNVIQFIEITGRLSKKDWIIKAKKFDVFINTSSIDNIPVSVIEAMALGLPVISTNVGGMPYLINNGVNGILVEENNNIEMTGAIVNLITNPRMAISLAMKARNDVENFDIAVVKKQWHKLLSQ